MNVEVDGLRIAYERTGASQPVVFAHGYVGDGSSTWRPQLDALGDEYDVIAAAPVLDAPDDP